MATSISLNGFILPFSVSLQDPQASLPADGCVSFRLSVSLSQHVCIPISMSWLISGDHVGQGSNAYSRGEVLGIHTCRDAISVPAWILRTELQAQSCPPAPRPPKKTPHKRDIKVLGISYRPVLVLEIGLSS